MTSTVDDTALATADRSARLEIEIQKHPERFRVLTGDRPTALAVKAFLLMYARLPGDDLYTCAWV